MGMLVLAGEDFNHLAGGLFTSTPAADANAPFSQVADGRPGIAGRFGTLTADPFFTCDTDLLRREGDFETWPGPLGWTQQNTLGGTVTQETTIKISGTSAAKFSTSSGSASAFRDRKVRAGDRIYFRGQLRGDAGAGVMRLRFRNLETGNWLQPGLTWSSSQSDVLSQTGIGGGVQGYTLRTSSFDVETFSQCRGARCTLRMFLLNDVAGTSSYADAVELAPANNLLAVFGHNIDPRIVCQLRGSTDGFVGSDVLIADQAVRQPSWYYQIPQASEHFRYPRLRFVGTNEGSDRIAIGEWVMGRALSLAQPPSYPIVRTFRDPQVRGTLPYGGVYSVGVGPAGKPPVGLQLTFRQGDTEAQQFIDEIILRSSGGSPLVVIPDDTKPDVYFGKISTDWETRREQFASHDCTLVLEPSPFPQLLP